ncbi:hypothetical protein QBC35DRAFT_468201 [Podospora australis]|uniref:ATPase AAA-type core domain-containing protein n=1 Tax=Podospora australis TaxID=1536484 RepID=A0AAN6WL02_9PEZI|nr:hypothetical protein QBC35DRAFT_468201 [Podospora australis]
MSRYVPGYSLHNKSWDAGYDIEMLKPVEANSDILDTVVLDSRKKSTVKTLVEGYVKGTTGYYDLIPGEGQCLIVLISGPPGTGKSLFVESLAEHLGCPLLRADPGCFSSTDDMIRGSDESLEQLLKDATEWNALVLFDEPSFLYQSDGNGAYNRELLHLGTLSADDLAKLASWNINGREIKNILNMSVAWCRTGRENQRLTVGVIEDLMAMIRPTAKKQSQGHMEPVTETTDTFSLLSLDPVWTFESNKYQPILTSPLQADLQNLAN